MKRKLKNLKYNLTKYIPRFYSIQDGWLIRFGDYEYIWRIR